MRAFIAVVLVLVAGCDYDAPITPEPTRAVESRLLGHWTLVQEKDSEHMTIRRFDGNHYVVVYKDDVYRAYHSETAGMPLISVQSLNDEERKFLFVHWKLSDDGQRLILRAVNTRVIPTSAKDSAAIAELIEKNRANGALFGESAEYTRDKR